METATWGNLRRIPIFWIISHAKTRCESINAASESAIASEE